MLSNDSLLHFRTQPKGICLHECLFDMSIRVLPLDREQERCARTHALTHSLTSRKRYVMEGRNEVLVPTFELSANEHEKWDRGTKLLLRLESVICLPEGSGSKCEENCRYGGVCKPRFSGDPMECRCEFNCPDVRVDESTFVCGSDGKKSV